MTFISPLTPAVRPVYSGHQNADIVRTWSQAATSNRSDALRVQKTVQAAIQHLHKAGTSLHYLDLSDSGLTTLPPVTVWQQLQGITILYLNQNNLPGSELEKLCALTTIQFLNISDNPLKQIPASALAGQKELHTLEANGCELQRFPEGVLMLPRVGILSLQDNPIRELPENIGNYMFSLGEMNIQGTEITCLPESLKLSDCLVNR